MKKKNLFIVFEGLEGSGKSTQAGLLASRLLEEGFDIKATREPGGTGVGELIRQITHSKDNVDLTAVAESYLMAASRAQHVREIIRPALDSGKIVISDRFVDSSLAYQGYGRELGEEKIAALNKMAVEEITPNLVIFLDVIPEIGFKRRNGTSKIDRLDLQQNDFYLRVYGGYKELAGKNKDKYFIVDSSKPIEEVAGIIWEDRKSTLLN